MNKVLRHRNKRLEVQQVSLPREQVLTHLNIMLNLLNLVLNYVSGMQCNPPYAGRGRVMAGGWPPRPTYLSSD